MTWSLKNLPDNVVSVAKKEEWTDAQKEAFIKAANAALEEYKDDGKAIAVGIHAARGTKENASFDEDQIRKGMEVEKEHLDVTKDPAKIMGIVLDHLKEDGQYYSKLETIENGSETSGNYGHLGRAGKVGGSVVPDKEKDKKSNSKELPSIYYVRHIESGLCGYENETILIQNDTLRKMNPTFAGKPVFVEHSDVNLDTLQEDADGYVIESFFEPTDGSFWAKIIVVSDAGKSAIKNAWGVSNAYTGTEFGGAGEYHNMPYNREVLNGEYNHLAIVPTPRYENAVVFTPEEFSKFKKEKELENSKFINSKGEAKTMTEKPSFGDKVAKFFGRKDVQEMFENACKENEKEEEKDEKENEGTVDVDGEKVSMAELKNAYKKMNAKKNSEEEDKEDKEDKENEKEEEEKEEEKENKKRNSKDVDYFDKINKSISRGDSFSNSIGYETMAEKLQRGNSKY